MFKDETVAEKTHDVFEQYIYINKLFLLQIETFKPEDGKPLEYKDLYDGVFLNDVMQQM